MKSLMVGIAGLALVLGGCGYEAGQLKQESFIKDLSNDPAAACITANYGPGGVQVVRAMPGAKVQATPGSCVVEYGYPAK